MQLTVFKENENFQARGQLVTWRRTHDYDHDDSWIHGTLPLPPEEFTQSLWSEVNALKDKISMPRQKVRNLINAIEQGKVSDEDFTILKRVVEKRDREAAQVNVTPVGIAQHCIPRSLNPETASDVYVSMEEKDEGRMNPELAELEPPSAGTGLGTPGQQCSPNEGIWETGRTITDGYLLVGMGSNQGVKSLHRRSSLEREPVQLRHRLIYQTPYSGSRATSPKTRINAAKRTNNLTPVGKERSHRFRTRL